MPPKRPGARLLAADIPGDPAEVCGSDRGAQPLVARALRQHQLDRGIAPGERRQGVVRTLATLGDRRCQYLLDAEPQPRDQVGGEKPGQRAVAVWREGLGCAETLGSPDAGHLSLPHALRPGHLPCVSPTLRATWRVVRRAMRRRQRTVPRLRA